MLNMLPRAECSFHVILLSVVTLASSALQGRSMTAHGNAVGMLPACPPAGGYVYVALSGLDACPPILSQGVALGYSTSPLWGLYERQPRPAWPLATCRGAVSRTQPVRNFQCILLKVVTAYHIMQGAVNL